MTPVPPADPTELTKRSRKATPALLLLPLAALVGFLLWRTAAPRRPSAASTPLATASTKFSEEARALLEQGRQQQQAGEYALALDAYWRALRSAPNDEAAWNAWAPLAARVLGAQRAHDQLRKFLQDHPDSARGHLLLAGLLQQSGYFRSAYEEAEAAARLDPRRADAWQLMGAAALAEGNVAQAEDAFRAAIARNPDDARSHAGLGEALAENRRRDAEARTAFEEAIRRAPNDPAPDLLLGRLLLRTAKEPLDFATARTHLLRAAQGSAALPPEGRFHAYLSLGQSYALQGRWNEARTWLERAQPLAPLDPTVPYELASVYRRLGDTARAARAREQHRIVDAYQRDARALTEKVAARPNDLDARLRLARLHARHRTPVEAIKSFRFLLLRAPNHKVARQEYEALTRRYGISTPPSP